jgi:hypothetical protein
MDGWSLDDEGFHTLADVFDSAMAAGPIAGIFRLLFICGFMAQDVCFNPLNWL